MNDVTSFRHAVGCAISYVRSNWFLASKQRHFPTDKELSEFLSITPQAFSNIVRGCSSASGVTLMKLLHELTLEQFQAVMRCFYDGLKAD